VLEFNADVRLLTVTLEKTGEQTIELGALPDGNQQLFTVAVLADLSAGDYLVSWRAVGADTHTVSGEIHFAVTEEESLASRLSADH
jgi:methionine-rich copper-binding protein CopC